MFFTEYLNAVKPYPYTIPWICNVSAFLFPLPFGSTIRSSKKKQKTFRPRLISSTRFVRDNEGMKRLYHYRLLLSFASWCVRNPLDGCMLKGSCVVRYGTVRYCTVHGSNRRYFFSSPSLPPSLSLFYSRLVWIKTRSTGAEEELRTRDHERDVQGPRDGLQREGRDDAMRPKRPEHGHGYPSLHHHRGLHAAIRCS